MLGRPGRAPGAPNRLRARARAVEALCRRHVGRDAVGQRAGALVLGALADLATVAVMGGERQVGVEVSLAQVERPVGVFKDLKEEEGDGFKDFFVLVVFRYLNRGSTDSGW